MHYGGALDKAPLCKGGCQPKADWGIVKWLSLRFNIYSFFLFLNIYFLNSIIFRIIK